MSDAKMRASRPLSPHLQVWRFSLTMYMSILHRITGGALYFGVILVAWWLIAAAAGPEYFEFVNAVFGSWIGQLILFWFTWALVHHMLGGLRHFIWDLGSGFGPEAREFMSRAAIIGSVALTILLWIIGYVVR